MKLPKQPAQGIGPRLIELGIIIVLGAGAVVLYGMVSSARKEVAQLVYDLEQEPETLTQQVTLRTDLRDYEDSLEQISSLVVSESEVGDIISGLESSAGKLDVELRVPKVVEAVTYDANGNPVTPTGPHKDIELEILAQGDPADLLQLLHLIEHAPQLLRATQWDLASLAVRRAKPLSVNSQPAAQLDATLLLTVKNIHANN